MKTYQIIGLIVIVIVLAIILSTIYSGDTYSNFSQSKKYPNKKHQIIGNLITSKPTIYITKKSYLSFYMSDNLNDTCKVIYKGEKPKDFEKLEQVVVIGQWQDSLFLASSLLLKCPSKYDNNNIPKIFNEKEF